MRRSLGSIVVVGGLAIAGALGCDSTKEVPPNDLGASARILLQRQAAPGTVEIIPMGVAGTSPAALVINDEAQVTAVVVRAWPAGASDELVYASGQTAATSDASAATVAGFALLSADGSLRALARPADAPTLGKTVVVQAASTPDGAVVIECSEAGAVAFRLASGALASAGDASALCRASQWIVGRSAIDGHVAGLVVDAAGIRVASYAVTGGAIAAQGPSFAHAFPAGVSPVLVEEVTAGVFEIVAVDGQGGAWTWMKSDGSPTKTTTAISTASGSGANVTDHAQRDPTGAILLVDGVAPQDAIAKWNVQGDGSVARVAASPASTLAGGSGWRATAPFGAALNGVSMPNDAGTAPLTTPIAYEARAFIGSAFVVSQPPTTPCSDRDACRLVGESYLLAVVGQGAARAGIFAFWSWNGPLGVYASPANRSAP